MAQLMKIRVLTFGIARDIAEADNLEIELPNGATAATLQSHLHELYPGFKRLKSLQIAINAEYAAPDVLLQENDEIAIIPPVSGG